MNILKKFHIRNLLVAILIYVLTPIIMCFISMLSNIIYLDGKHLEDETIYILSILATAVVSLVSYLIFYIIQRRKVKKENIEFLGIGKRIIGGLVASVIAITTLFGMSFKISPYGDSISLLRLYIDTTIVFLAIFVVVNFIVFIILKPRP